MNNEFLVRSGFRFLKNCSASFLRNITLRGHSRLSPLQPTCLKIGLFELSAQVAVEKTMPFILLKHILDSLFPEALALGRSFLTLRLCGPTQLQLVAARRQWPWDKL